MQIYSNINIFTAAIFNLCNTKKIPKGDEMSPGWNMISKVPSTRNKHNMSYLPQNTLSVLPPDYKTAKWG